MIALLDLLLASLELAVVLADGPTFLLERLDDPADLCAIESELAWTGAPLAWRSADELLEGAAERSFGFITNFMRDDGYFGGWIG